MIFTVEMLFKFENEQLVKTTKKLKYFRKFSNLIYASKLLIKNWNLYLFLSFRHALFTDFFGFFT